MKKIIILSIILINCIACSNGQNKNNTNSKQDLSTEILGCWEIVDMYYELKSNYPNIDTIIINKQKDTFKKENSYITKFYENLTSRVYQKNGKSDSYVDNYIVVGDSIVSQNTVRKDTKLLSKIKIENDSLYLTANTPRVFYNALRSLEWECNIDLPQDLKLEKMVRHVICVRVADCDKYKEEEE